VFLPVYHSAMVIAVNTRLLLKNKLEGIGWFSHEVLQRITRQHPEHQFVFCFDRPFNDQFVYAENVIPIVLSPQARHPWLWYYWFEFAIPKALKKYKADIFFSPESYASLKPPVKQVITFHDLSLLHYPGQTKASHAKYAARYFPRFAKKANRIITVSAYTKNDIANTMGINPDIIDVAYNGANTVYSPLETAEKETVLKKYSEGRSYFLYVGALHPRKNIANLLKAFDRFRLSATENYQLLLTGRKAWMTADIDTVYSNMKYKDDVRFLGYRPVEELRELYGAATALVYVSFFEGFGIPILEAMQCGVPVITSDVSSMPEVAGEAGYLVDPENIQQISDGMKAISENVGLRQKMIEKGLEHCKKFSWDITADNVWQSLSKVMNS
jgi:glycosyltransferase involved in cell wall biosynthesis